MLGIFGTWILGDGIYSLVLYTDRRDSRAQGQSWLRDHWLRLLRIIIGLALMAMGWQLR